MLIVIPTYKRNACLKWVLQSLIQCKTDGIDEPIRVLVVNNYPPARNEIEVIVDEFRKNKKFEWNILYREKTLPPVENWYSAILEWALPNEVVIINSDDDLFLPWSIKNRFEEINRVCADLLLAKIAHGLYFSQQAKKAYYKFEDLDATNCRANVLDYEKIYLYSPQHLSNHCYRNTQHFQDGLTRAMSWCHAQDWLDFNNRTLFITLYLAYAIVLSGGTVAGLERFCIIRGRDAEEIRTAKYGVPSWNHGFIHLCALGVLNNLDLKDIHQLDSVRRDYRDQFIRWFFTCLFDSRVSLALLKETLRKVEFPLSKLCSLKIFYGLELVFKDLLQLRGLRLQRDLKCNNLPTEEIMERLRSLSPL